MLSASYDVYLYESSGNTISGNTANSTGAGGILITGGGEIGCNNNTVSDNVVNSGDSYGSSFAIVLVSASHDNTVLGNTVTRAKLEGIYVSEGSHSNTISGNTISETPRRLMKNPRWGWNDLQGSGLAAT